MYIQPLYLYADTFFFSSLAFFDKDLPVLQINERSVILDKKERK